MHTLKVIAGGILLLAACLFVGRLLDPVTAAGLAKGAKVFLPVWLICAVVNMWLGVTKAGYTAAEEAPTLVVVFAVPAAIALITLWWISRA